MKMIMVLTMMMVDDKDVHGDEENKVHDEICGCDED
jgi:hypothetical protein